jgi:hypothetical protein
MYCRFPNCQYILLDTAGTGKGLLVLPFFRALLRQPLSAHSTSCFCCQQHLCAQPGLQGNIFSS